MNISDIDLMDECPPGLEVEIEGFKSMPSDQITVEPFGTIFEAIAVTYCTLTAKQVTEDGSFLRRITITALNMDTKLIKVRVAEP